ncbi:carbohydrate ABC transporter permease [Ancrocorticia populi]|uniref:carbohydrate ABC transporter permease n=1 Tax=Ancrocorticia populi TaxID=2175228 RepID=UPI002356D28D|nr:carbohydrate ABC transporter permease [Ancrocorticia populi]
MAFLVLSVFYFLMPLWWLIVSSTKSNTGLQTSNGFWFDAPQLMENVERTLNYDSGLFLRWLLNSFLYSGTAAVVGTAIAVAAGYVFAKFSFWGKGAMFGAIIAGVMVPSALLTIPLYFLASAVGLVNTPWAVIIPTCVSPFGVYLARIYAESSIPDELLEAARIDGAGEFRIFRSVALKILGPAMVTIFLFIFVSAWNNFLLPLMMLNSDRLKPVTLGLYGWQTYRGAATYDIVLTGSLISIIPMGILFFALQKYIRTGLAAGSVKG